ncbi:MAG: hypothetical protein ACLSTO_09575 [Bilophila wadsworthia]
MRWCVTLSVEYRFFHADGSSISCTVMGEGETPTRPPTRLWLWPSMPCSRRSASPPDIGQDPDAS